MKLTPAMIIAGSDELSGRADDNSYEVAQDVFIAMLAAAGIHWPIVRLPSKAVSAYRSALPPPGPQKAQLPGEPSVSFSVDETELVAIDRSFLLNERNCERGP